jgi:lipoprotein-releasing system permease protein
LIHSQVNDIKKTLYNGQWIEPDTYQVVVGYGIAQKFSMDCWISINNWKF